jgi:hypothetical protein
MSLYVMVFAGSAPIGGLFAGALAEAFGAPAAFSIGAGLAFGVLGFVAWHLRGVRPPRIENRPAPPVEDETPTETGVSRAA